MDRNRVLVVVSKFKEDVSWVDDLGFPCITYDKSGQKGPYALPNIGRETHTFLHHIVEHYPDFPAYNVFLQADPLKHMEPGTGVSGLRDKILEYVEADVGFAGFAWYRIRCDRLGRPHDMHKAKSKGKWPGYGRDIPVGEIFERLFGRKSPQTFISKSPAGIFFVSRRRILARPHGFYRLALKISESDPLDEFNTGHAFERLWHIIFNGYTPLNRDDYGHALKSLRFSMP